MEVTPAGTVYSVTFDPRTNQIASQDDGMGNVAQFKYDAFGNLTTLVAPNAAIVSYSYATGSSQGILSRRSTPTA